MRYTAAAARDTTNFLDGCLAAVNLGDDADTRGATIPRSTSRPLRLNTRKALETELNAIIFAGIRPFYAKSNPTARHTQIGGTRVDLGEAVLHQSLGAISSALEHNDDVRRALRIAFGDSDAQFLSAELPSHLAPIIEQRNPAAHSSKLRRDQAGKLRSEVMGIGREGLITRLARIKLRKRK